MFAAVGNDPALAAEAIARPALVQRLIRSWYARDDRFHGDVREEAQAGWAALRAGLVDPRGAGIIERAWLRRGSPADRPEAAGNVLDLDAWSELQSVLTVRFGTQELRAHTTSPLVDEDDSYRVYVVREAGDGLIRLGIASWPKVPFEAWWSANASSFAVDLAVEDGEEVLLPLTGGSGGCVNDSWHPLGNVVPLQRYSHSAVWTGTEMIVWGGWTPVLPFATGTGGRYVPATDSWYPTSTTGAPLPRLGHRAVWTGSAMLVWGGQQEPDDTSTAPLGDGARYAPLTDTWTPISNTGAPSARRDFTMVWTGSRAVVFGGRDASGVTNTGGRYDPQSDLWAATSVTGAPAARDRHASVWTGSAMVVWGGTSLFEINTGGVYDPASDAWQPTSTTGAPLGRADHTAVWTGSHVIVWGGCKTSTATCFADGGRYDPSANTWTPTSTTGVQARRDHVAVWTGSSMIVWGGIDVNENELATGGRYDPATNTWTATTATGAPERRYHHTAVWTGTEMIVWGGIWESPPPIPTLTYFNNGGRYAPASDSWVPTSVPSVGPPQAREKHSAVWTGTETIFWGGDGLSGPLGDGSRYFAATDSWWPTTASGAPAPRREHRAVWTGTEMIVWGGNDLSGQLGSGARYQPASDGWSAVSSSGAPSGRSLHTAIWSGSKMVVWGGTSGVDENSGGRYDPAGDAWAAIGTTGAPAARSRHTAVWSGSRMIVWGGVAGATRVDTGGRYDPVTDVWSPTALSAVPAARADHTAVWTGSRMIVWGGSDAGGDRADGGRYDPVGDSWTPTSSTGAPAARSRQTAVWTGMEMLVWGGAASPILLNSGGRYLPAGDSWTPMTTAGAPSPRHRHASIWAGDEMLVWGGNTFNSPTDTGASYCACRTFWRDDDGDGYGNGDGGAPTLDSCDGTTPVGWVDNGLDCWDANPAVHPGIFDSTCNGVDDDCDTFVDDDFLGQFVSCGQGVCHSFGFLECVGGQVQSSCVPGTPTAPIDDACNSLDDDCDGGIDEDFVEREDYWTPTAAGAPASRTNHTAVWSGSEMIVFGGDNGSGTVGVGGFAYAPASSAWRSLAAGPAKRWHHTAVWTGSRMIVWGGDDNVATIYNNGSRYDPATDTWTVTTTTGAPTARGGHSAVWTGSRMVVWGGRDVTSTFNTGSRYDPVANSWVATTTTGAAAARAFHTAVWAGTEMIVWGGQNLTGTALGTGGRYNPTSNTWTAVTTTGAPSARYGHVSVWTGTEMIVWGGTTDGTTFLPNGARYNPASNTWTPMSAGGAPSRRAWASAVWTGTEMFVWGGTFRTNEEPDTPLADGARYNPATDSWTSMNPLSVPTARARAAAVWTGTEMIVWGGDPNGSARSDGGRYNPKTICGTGGCQRTGATFCSAGTTGFQCTPATSVPEVCDGIDNDCDVTVDEGIPVPSGRPSVLGAKLDAAGTVQLTWSATADTTGYDVARGAIGVLLSTGGDFTLSTNACLANNTSAPQAQDGAPPSVGDGFWYLVRPVNACSGNGSYDEPQPPQQGSRDAEIAASPVACP